EKCPRNSFPLFSTIPAHSTFRSYRRPYPKLSGRRQPPWRNVSEMSKTSKQWSHPGSASVAQQVPVVPPERGMSRSDKGLKGHSPFTLARESPARWPG
ncbi:MAG: hypothetical protein II465_01195, partial [Bacteroidales bacterium]|nr:hypothetical protein [Bacteroidales bacterium]